MAPPGADISGVSLGMVIIDEIRIPNQKPLIDIIGGSATFVTLGQRLFAANPSSVGCLILAGNDFSQKVEAQLRELGVTLALIRKEGERSSRGLLEYKDDAFGAKTFKYTSGPLKASPNDLEGTPLLAAKAVHFFATPEEVLVQVPALHCLREQCGIAERPLIVWEPFPASCKAENIKRFVDACKLVDVFSPNHLEMASLSTDSPAADLTEQDVEEHGKQFLETSSIGPTGDGTLIIRSGEHGSLSTISSSRPVWHPPFYEPGSSKVVDVTGAGNTFLGGYIAGWLATGSKDEAIHYGHVAASFALEQLGLPRMREEGGKELWNGASVTDRLEKYKARITSRAMKSSCFV